MRKTTTAWKHARPLTRLLLPAVWLLLGISCKDPDRPKPNDKFYCKVDGKAWRPDSDGDFKLNTLLAELTNDKKYLFITATNAKLTQSISFIMSNEDTLHVGEYELSVIKTVNSLPPSAYFSKVPFKGSVKFIDYTTSTTNKGTFRILSLEKDARLPAALKMKAEFEFAAANSAGEVVRITNGQFNDWVNIKQ